MWSLADGPGHAVFADLNDPVTTVIFDRFGDYILRLSASDTQTEVSQTLAVSTKPNINVFEDWVLRIFPGETDPAIIAPEADPDGDFLVNAGEFGLGLNPSREDAVPFSSGQPGLPRGEIVHIGGTDYLALLVKRPKGRLGISYAPAASGDFAAWTSVTQNGPATENGDGTETVTYLDNVPMAGAPTRFMRLSITLP